jgi:hypothetical protein
MSRSLKKEKKNDNNQVYLHLSGSDQAAKWTHGPINHMHQSHLFNLRIIYHSFPSIHSLILLVMSCLLIDDGQNSVSYQVKEEKKDILQQQ